MSSSVQALAGRGLISPPPFVVSNLCYECLTGSVAYGVSSDASDNDIYGFCIPPKDILFPHLAGHVHGFNGGPQDFGQYMQHHVEDPSNAKSYDFTIYNIVKYFDLCMDCNPNMIDSLFVPETCVKHITQIGQMVREKRKLFLSKRAWPRFKGYAYKQVHKLDNKEPTGKRLALVEQHGYDTKYAYHVVRLLDEIEQILTTGDIDLQRDNDELKAIRRGEWTETQVHEHFQAKIAKLEIAKLESSLPEEPDTAAIKRLLLDCLEHHYGDLTGCVVREDAAVTALKDISAILDRVKVGGIL